MVSSAAVDGLGHVRERRPGVRAGAGPGHGPRGRVQPLQVLPRHDRRILEDVREEAIVELGIVDEVLEIEGDFRRRQVRELAPGPRVLLVQLQVVLLK